MSIDFTSRIVPPYSLPISNVTLQHTSYPVDPPPQYHEIYQNSNPVTQQPREQPRQQHNSSYTCCRLCACCLCCPITCPFMILFNCFNNICNWKSTNIWCCRQLRTSQPYLCCFYSDHDNMYSKCLHCDCNNIVVCDENECCPCFC